MLVKRLLIHLYLHLTLYLYLSIYLYIYICTFPWLYLPCPRSIILVLTLESPVALGRPGVDLKVLEYTIKGDSEHDFSNA